MGYDATNYVPATISRDKLFNLIEMLEFNGSGKQFFFYKEDDYKYLYGVGLMIEKTKDEWLCHTRTPIYCSIDDLKYQNHVMKCLKQYLGGFFISDNGKNRYFDTETITTSISERGCYNAHFRLSNQFSYAKRLLMNHKENKDIIAVHREFGVPSSTVLLANIITTYISSVIENYFRDLYVALLKDSEKKEKTLQNTRLNPNDLLDISEGRICIEQAVALSKSFQNINKINSYFHDLDKNIDIKGVLSRPYHQRKETLFMTLNRILEHRHSLVHRLDIHISYYDEDIKKDIKSVEVALDRVYLNLCDLYKWQYINDF